MRVAALIFLFLSTSIWANDCLYQTQERLCVGLTWVEGPFLDAYSKNVVTFQNIDTKEFKSPSSPVKFYAWMKMGTHEHGSRPIQTKMTQEGVYENSQIFFMGGMMGTWEFKLKVGNEDVVLFNLRS